MEIADEHVSIAARSWSNRAERRHSAVVDYSSELRSWVQHAISQAEEMKDFSKKGKFLSLLKDL